jgi:hypothetical protein
LGAKRGLKANVDYSTRNARLAAGARDGTRVDKRMLSEPYR